MAVWSQMHHWYGMFCRDTEVMSANPSWVKLGSGVVRLILLDPAYSCENLYLYILCYYSYGLMVILVHKFMTYLTYL